MEGSKSTQQKYSKWGLTLAGLGAPGIMWVLDKLEFVWPPYVLYVVGAASLLMLLGAAYFWVPDTLRLLKSKDQRYRMGVYVLSLGIVVAIAGLALIVVGYRLLMPNEESISSGEIPALVDTTQQAVDEPNRHYSLADKDRISEAFHKIREILNHEADPLQLEIQRIWQQWNQRQSKFSDVPLNIESTIDRLESARAEASRLSNAIFSDLLNSNKSYEPLLKSVLAYQIPDPFRELYQHIDRIKGALASANTVYQDVPDKPNEVATMVLRILDPFAETNARVNGWIHDTLRRVEEQQSLVLSKI